MRLAVASAAASIVALAGLAMRAHAQDSTQRPVIALGAVLDSVAARYPLVLAAEARVRAARAGRVTAGVFANPILGYQLSYNVDNTPGPGGSFTQGLDRVTAATVTLPLEPLYQRGPRMRRAAAEVRAASNDAIAERQRAVLAATRAYDRAALAQVSVSTARNLVVWLDSLVRYNRDRARAGVAAQADLIRSEVERDRAAADATVQEAELARARADLATFIGASAAGAEHLRVAVDPLPLALPAMSPDSAPVEAAGGTSAANARQSRALLRRPDVRAARERVQATAASISAERSLIVRQLGLTIGQTRTLGRSSLIAGVSLPLPLFDQNGGNIARAAAERDAAAYELAARQRAVRAQVRGAYDAARLLTRRAAAMGRTAEGFLARADEARRIALGAYREGAVPLIQVLDAARAWNAAQLTYYRTIYAQHDGVLALVYAEGRDLRATLPTLTTSATSNR